MIDEKKAAANKKKKEKEAAKKAAKKAEEAKATEVSAPTVEDKPLDEAAKKAAIAEALKKR